MATFGDAVCSGEIVAVPQPISENPKDAKMAIARTKKPGNSRGHHYFQPHTSSM